MSSNYGMSNHSHTIMYWPTRCPVLGCVVETLHVGQNLEFLALPPGRKPVHVQDNFARNKNGFEVDVHLASGPEQEMVIRICTCVLALAFD